MEVDGQGMGVLGEQQCFALLAQVRIGRIALTSQALPIILPVLFARLDGDLVFRVGAGPLARAASLGQVACFETDWSDEHFASAWSVNAIGHLSTMVEPTELDRVRHLDLMEWSSSCNTFIRLTPRVISGRRRSR